MSQRIFGRARRGARALGRHGERPLHRPRRHDACDTRRRRGDGRQGLHALGRRLRAALPHARLLPRLGPVPVARHRPRLEGLCRPARRALPLLLPALARDPVGAEIRSGLRRHADGLRPSPRAVAERAVRDAVVRLSPRRVLGRDEAPARCAARHPAGARGGVADHPGAHGLDADRRVLRPLRLFPRRLFPRPGDLSASPVEGYPTLASLPVVSLALGAIGAVAVVTVAALLTPTRLATPFRHCGRHSIAIYLAFFLPMAATRAVLLKSGAIDDVGLVSALVTAVAVVAPLILERLVRTTPLSFLFRRPAAFHIAPGRAPRLQPAE